MRKVIDGRRYDTETAIEVGESNHGRPGDWAFMSETLYRTRRGAWFLHGAGGPLSSYGERCGSNERTGSERIIPLTEDEAFEWAQDALDGETVDAFFSAHVSDA